MCLIFFGIQQHPDYKLIVAANRDEFYNRPTLPAQWWDEKEVLAGTDIEAGGTWMGIHKNGKIAWVTNYRDIKNLKEVAPSRGKLVSDFLENKDSAHDYLEKLLPHASTYNGFNLVVGNVNELWYASNYKEGFGKITVGVHGLSNALLNTPWPKVESGKQEFSEWISKKEVSIEDLFSLLKNENRANDHQLPNTGIGIERERVLSARFIKSQGYGTRCSTIILINQQNEVNFIERTYDLSTFDYTEKTYQFICNG